MGQVDFLLAALSQEPLYLVAPISERGGLVGSRGSGRSGRSRRGARRLTRCFRDGIAKCSFRSSQEVDGVSIAWVECQDRLGPIPNYSPV